METVPSEENPEDDISDVKHSIISEVNDFMGKLEEAEKTECLQIPGTKIKVSKN